ncbi:uncharacterized protein LOC127861948 isoform X2 [Dreissena polymorpha]|uniref:uncharacterized protein LOC127861948 isoform X2 n=1 Tax=Dreissena polymorpha TaxID=45954 RepID=UPI0022643FB4|nr:uncharacterized protein LOC127861948 isoform X2 [Dreissena polymorpha]
MRFLRVYTMTLARIWTQIIEHYSEPQRHYHTMRHVKEMLQYVHPFENRLQRKHLIVLATIFHDVIYDPQKPDNEDKSAEFFQQCMAELEEEICDLTNDGQQAEQEVWDKFQAAIQHIDQCRSEFDANVKMVVDWILQTKGHLTAVTTTPDMYGDDDLHFFLDMDLGILGADRTRYMEYAADIRKEYCHVPDGVFHRRRIEFLERFLERKNVYNTLYFRSLYEAAARSNIDAEIKLLKRETNTVTNTE